VTRSSACFAIIARRKDEFASEGKQFSVPVVNRTFIPMSNLETARQIYSHFARGDVAAILALLSESVVWEYGPTSTKVPWLQRREGRDGAAGFFASLAEMELHKLDPKEFLEARGVVVALVDVDLTIKSTGRRIVEDDEIHVWRFHAEGRSCGFGTSRGPHDARAGSRVAAGLLQAGGAPGVGVAGGGVPGCLS
jgi:uncharacterized protein